MTAVAEDGLRLRAVQVGPVDGVGTDPGPVHLLRFQVLGAFSGSVPMSFMVINTLVVFGYGGYLVLNDALSIGDLVAFSIYQGRVFAPLQGMMDGFLSTQKSKVALARVREIFDVEPTYEQGGSRVLGDGQLRGDIAFKDVSFAYEPGEPVLTDQSFHIPAGKITAIVGPSGVGKTTACHLILRLFDPDTGTITLDGLVRPQENVNYTATEMSCE